MTIHLQLTYDETVNFTAIPNERGTGKSEKNGLNIKIKKKTSHFRLTLINYQKLIKKILDFFLVKKAVKKNLERSTYGSYSFVVNSTP